MRKPPRSWQTQRRLKSWNLMLSVPSNAPRRTPGPRKLTIEEMRADVSANPPNKRTAVSAYAPYLTPPNNPRPSRAYGDEEIDALVADLVAARAARGHRKAMRRPFRRRGQNDLFDVVRLHLRRLCRRVLNDRCRGGLDSLDHDLLVQALERYVEQQLWHLVYHHDYGEQRAPQRLRRTYLDESRSGMTAIESVARSSARYALDTWSPDYIREMQRLGKIGGKISKRPATYNDADLDQLAKLAHLPNMQARADALGRKLRTTERMWSTLQQRG